MLFFELLPGKLKALWDGWGIELLVLASFALQAILTFFGSRRRYKTDYKMRFFVWFAYLLNAKVATVVLGKLTVIPVDGGQRRTHSELLALLAPVIFLQIGNPDSITAYSIEDNQLGVRQVLSLIIQVVIVIYILVRSWTNSPISYLYLPMSLAGVIKYGETAWALKTALIDSTGLTVSFFGQQLNVSSLYEKLPKENKEDYMVDAEYILRAYYRFYILKPHLENWLYQPLYESGQELYKIDQFNYEEIFRITDSELGFMYDVLYTKAPIVYTRTGCILRVVSFVSLVGTLCGFIFLFGNVFVYHIGAGFIYFVLIAALVFEVYQILLLPFSDWAIVKLIKHHQEWRVCAKLLRVLAPQSKRWRRWSNSMGQFNLLSFCMHGKYAKISRNRILINFGMDMKIRKLKNTSVKAITPRVKEIVVEEMEQINMERKERPFVEIGKWTIERYKTLQIDKLKGLLDQQFDKIIVTMHIVTDVCYHTDGSSKANDLKIDATKMLADYMMYLLTNKSHVLGTTTSEIVFDHACERLRSLIVILSLTDIDKACNELRKLDEETHKKSELNRDKVLQETVVTKGWQLLKEIKELAESLMELGKEDCWKVIRSVWVEMLCFAASNCEMEYHSEHLRQGGELFTHVWLLLAHKTNKYYSVGDLNL